MVVLYLSFEKVPRHWAERKQSTSHERILKAVMLVYMAKIITGHLDPSLLSINAIVRCWSIESNAFQHVVAQSGAEKKSRNAAICGCRSHAICRTAK